MPLEEDARWMFERLEELASKLGVHVRVETLGERDGDLVFQSGACLLKGERLVLVDRRLPWSQKCRVLAQALRKMETSHVFVPPRVRMYLEE